MKLVDKVLSKYSPDYVPEHEWSSRVFKMSANIDAEHKAILSVLTDKKIVENQTEAVKFLIEAGYKYLLNELPDFIADDVKDRKEEIFSIINSEPEFVEIPV